MSDASSGIARTRVNRLAGASFFLAGAVAFLGIITAEVLYPNYSARQDISDLGSTLPPDPVIHQPSATIFNATMISTGILLVLGTYLLNRAWDRSDVTVPLVIFGTAVVGVGIFPGNVTPWHGLSAMIAFFSGAFTVLLTARAVARPFSWISLAFGGVSLVVLLSAIGLNVANPLLVLGSGGVERWVVYPVLLWLLGFGGYLLGDGKAARSQVSSS